MIRRLRAHLSTEGGFSLIELSVGMVLSSMIAASLISVFYAFTQNSGDLAARSDVQANIRSVLAEQAVSIRQAVRADPNGEPVESLSSSRLAFYTQNYATAEIERVVYERKSCVVGECELWVDRYAFDVESGGISTFESIPYQTSLLLGNVLSGQALFVGVELLGDPLVAVETSACDGVSVDCDFPLVAITLRARPAPTTAGAATPIEVYQEVAIRNG